MFKRFSLSCISFIIISLTFVGCDLNIEKGDKNLKKEQRILSFFNKININGAYEIILIKDSCNKIIIETDSNLLKLINTSVTDSLLLIESKKTIVHSSKLLLKLHYKTINSIVINGALELRSDSLIEEKELYIDVSGAAKLDLFVKAEKLNSIVSGGSTIFLEGKIKKFNASLSGICNIEAYRCKIDTCTIDISGFGKADVSVDKYLSVNISGAGKVSYKGNPIVKQNITGLGKVESE